MIRGVNRQVVEVNQPENAYFERVLFFVKPEYYGVSEKTLKAGADSLIKKSGERPPKNRRNKKEKIKAAIRMAAAAISGAAITAVLIMIFG